MHRCIQKPPSKGRIGVLLALALLSSFLYKWNEKQKLQSKQIKDKVLLPITARKAELSNCTTGVTKEKFGIGISNAEKDRGFPLPAVYKHCSDSLGELQDIMGRAFHDKDETCISDSTDESEDESCTLKDIESEAFTIALNLYYLTKHLPESVSSAVNTNHYHLMTTNALFCFGTKLSKNTASTSTELEELLQRYKLPLMVIVLFQLKQILPAGNSDLAKHLQVLGFHTMEMRDAKAAIAALRALMVAEMLDNRVEYKGYLTNESVEYEQ